MASQTKERGMIFTAEMVRALLNGDKTQTRRPLIFNNDAGWRVEQNEYGTALRGRITCPHPKKDRFGVFIQRDSVNGRIETDLIPCPFGQVGDRIWVREAFSKQIGAYGEEHILFYRADSDDKRLGPWTPSIHMPRWASRITLEITDVRVERLQDMTQQDALAEGCHHEGWVPTYSDPDNSGMHESISARDNYADLWNSLYGNWNDNPWVWVISFDVVNQEAMNHTQEGIN